MLSTFVSKEQKNEAIVGNDLLKLFAQSGSRWSRKYPRQTLEKFVRSINNFCIKASSAKDASIRTAEGLEVMSFTYLYLKKNSFTLLITICTGYHGCRDVSFDVATQTSDCQGFSKLYLTKKKKVCNVIKYSRQLIRIKELTHTIPIRQ